jgi:hypothetical protein
VTGHEVVGLAFDITALLSATWLWLTSFRRQSVKPWEHDLH